jgi:hypothetical protein
MLKKMLLVAGCVAVFGGANGMYPTVERTEQVRNIVLQNLIPTIAHILAHDVARSADISPILNIANLSDFSAKVKSISDKASECLTGEDCSGAYQQIKMLEKIKFDGDGDMAKIAARIMESTKNSISNWIRRYKVRVLINKTNEIFKISETKFEEDRVNNMLLGLRILGEHYIAKDDKDMVDGVFYILKYPSNLFPFMRGSCLDGGFYPNVQFLGEQICATSEKYVEELHALHMKKESKKY